MRILVLLTALPVLLFSAAPPLPASDHPGALSMTVRAEASGDGIPGKGTRFRIPPVAGEERRAVEAIAAEAARILEGRGYVREGERPGILFSVAYECLPLRIETAAGPGGDLKDERLYVKGSFTETRFSRKIRIRVFETGSSAGGPPLWSGEVESAGSCGDTPTDAPLLLEELLGEFPRPTGRPAERVRSRWEAR